MKLLEAHDLFELPETSTTLWRYMSFSKAVSMLRSGALFFSRTDKLDAFDRFEGTLPERNYLLLTPTQRREISTLRMKRLVNCWNAREHESYGLWHSYVPDTGDGVAIRTSVERLRLSLAATPHPVYASRVKYIDFGTELLSDKLLNFVYLYKRMHFEDEREVRLAIGTEGTIASGLPVKVDLDALIESVVVPPTASEWFAHEVALLFERYG